jgi:hypothetical protein
LNALDSMLKKTFEDETYVVFKVRSAG